MRSGWFVHFHWYMCSSCEGVWKCPAVQYPSVPVMYILSLVVAAHSLLHRANQLVETGKLLNELIKSDFLPIHLLLSLIIIKQLSSRLPVTTFFSSFFPSQAYSLTQTSLPTLPYAGSLLITGQAGAERLPANSRLLGEEKSKLKK